MFALLDPVHDASHALDLIEHRAQMRVPSLAFV